MQEFVKAQLPQGAVVGLREYEVCCFRAIPYARPPVGHLRFKPPEPANWSGTLLATEPGAIAPQAPSRLRDSMGDFQATQAEDCLNLSVYTPAVDSGRRPVVVWLHGGAWQSGAAAIDWYSGHQLAKRGDIVVVSPNYRLAALGWLAIKGETANVGLLDHELALQWVQDNIEAFGGDPDSVTVMGQSAGAMSIACLLMREPQFKRAIMQSAPLGRGCRSIESAHEISSLILQVAGADSLSEARDLPVRALVEAQKAPKVQEWLQKEGAQRSLFCPVADGEVLPLTASTELGAAIGKVDVLVGSTVDEMAAFFADGISQHSHEVGERIYGDPSRNWASDASQRGRKAWAYEFGHRPNDRFGACHCIELPFLFDTVTAFKNAPMLEGLQEQDKQRLTKEMQQAWISFIREGEPGWPTWPHEQRFL